MGGFFVCPINIFVARFNGNFQDSFIYLTRNMKTLTNLHWDGDSDGLGINQCVRLFGAGGAKHPVIYLIRRGGAMVDPSIRRSTY